MNISVYITSYNQKDYLIKAIESVLAQTLRPYQIIIADDASQDGSQEVIAGYKSRYPGLITPVHHEYNQGVSMTRNDALQAATGDFVTYLDGDDLYLPQKLEREAQCLQETPNAQMAFSNYYIINEQGERIDIWANHTPPDGDVFCQTFGRDFPKRRLFRNELVPYQEWKKIGFYDLELNIYEDYDMRIRLTKQLITAYTHQPLIEYRRNTAGLSRSKLARHITSFDHICKKNIHLLDDLSPDKQKYTHRKLGEWKAALLRRQGLEALSGGPNLLGSRRKALTQYRHAWKYHRHFDYKFWLEFLLPGSNYKFIKTLFYRFNRGKFRGQ